MQEQPNEEQRQKDEAHWREANRLWRAVKRDYLTAVEMIGGQRELDNARLRRLEDNWNALCALDIRVASRLAHGFEQLDGIIQRHGDPTGPDAHNLRQMQEAVEIARLGREANPEAEVDTVGELYALGEEEIRRQVDDEFPGNEADR